MSAEWLEGNRSQLLLPADVICAINFINSLKTLEYELKLPSIRRFVLMSKHCTGWYTFLLAREDHIQQRYSCSSTELKTGQEVTMKNTHTWFSVANEETESHFSIASIKQSFWKAFPFVSHLLYPFEFFRELWTLGTRKWERRGRRCFSAYILKQMSLCTQPQQVRG